MLFYILVLAHFSKSNKLQARMTCLCFFFFFFIFRSNNEELERRFRELEEWKRNQKTEKLKLKENFEVDFCFILKAVSKVC